MTAQAYIVFGALLGAIGVAAGAMGAHAFERTLTPENLARYEVAIRYLLFHAVAVVLVGLVLRAGPSKAAQGAGLAFLAGCLLFSGGLIAWIFTGIKPLVHVVPLGGVAWILGWLFLALAGWTQGAGNSP
jgi:uncharacterized membrane protein YgdD (TMEM256/DUF423 family)